MEQTLTPAQQAREYAAANGFHIVPVGKRYNCIHIASNTEFTRGSYTALLNEMRAIVNAEKFAAQVVRNATAEERAHGAVAVDAETGALAVPADTVVGEAPTYKTALNAEFGKMGALKELTEEDIAIIRSNNKAMQFSDLYRRMDAEFDQQCRALSPQDLLKLVQMATGATLDKIARAKGWTARRGNPLQTDAQYRNVLLYGVEHIPALVSDYDILARLGTPADKLASIYGVYRAPGESDTQLLERHKQAVPFEDFNEESKRRIRKAAKRIRKAARKAKGLPVGGPWQVIFNGRQLTKPGYPSRDAAVSLVRWGFNHSDPTIRNNWRTAKLAIVRNVYEV